MPVPAPPAEVVVGGGPPKEKSRVAAKVKIPTHRVVFEEFEVALGSGTPIFDQLPILIDNPEHATVTGVQAELRRERTVLDDTGFDELGTKKKVLNFAVL